MKVIKVQDDSLSILEFQTDKYGETSIKPETRSIGLELTQGQGNYISIESSEFADAWTRLLRRLNNIEI